MPISHEAVASPPVRRVTEPELAIWRVESGGRGPFRERPMHRYGLATVPVWRLRVAWTETVRSMSDLGEEGVGSFRESGESVLGRGGSGGCCELAGVCRVVGVAADE